VPVITYTMTDGSSTTPATLTLSVDAVNDAPVASSSATLTAINEDAGTPAGALVSSLFAGTFSDATDSPAADTLAGIAITSHTADAAKGAWQYQVNATGAWTALGTGTPAAAITLKAADLLRFVPAANYNGAATPLSANLIESGGVVITSGGTINLSAVGATGGTTVYSASAVALNHTVTAVDDAPVNTTAGSISTVSEDSANETAAALWSTAPVYGAGGGADESAQELSYRITNIPSFISLFKADGTTAVAVNSTVTAAEFAGLKYKTAANANGTANVTFDVIDSGSSTSPNANVLSTQSVSMTVSAVNDAPVNTTTSPLAGTEDTAMAITGLQVTDIDTASVTVTLTQTNGTLTLLSNVTEGLIASNITGNGTSVVTLVGTPAAINATLAATGGVTYTPTSNFNGSATLTVLTNDGSATDSEIVTINVAAADDSFTAGNNTNATNEDADKQIKSVVEMSLEGEELDADIHLQRWNYFVINYDGKTMDIFMNNKLIFKSDFIMPDIQLKPITVGDTSDNEGLNGSICNFAFHKYPLTKEQIRWTYTMLKSQNPPMIGMSTIEDQVKVTDSTKIYSR
jgi:hypothetical protein